MKLIAQIIIIAVLGLGLSHSGLMLLGMAFFSSTYGDGLVLTTFATAIIGMASIVMMMVPIKSRRSGIKRSFLPWLGFLASSNFALKALDFNGVPDAVHLGNVIVMAGFFLCGIFLMMSAPSGEKTISSNDLRT